MASRLIARRKKSTVLVSKRTLDEAIQRATMLAENMDPSDPELGQIEQAVDHMTQVLQAGNIDAYVDDAVNPQEARKLKNEVDMILKMHRAQRDLQQVNNVPDSAVYQHGADQYPSGAAESGQYEYDPNMPQSLHPISESVHASKKADGGAAFVSDRDEKAEAKAPEHLEVPRVAKRKVKKEAEDPIPEPPVPPVPPADIAAPVPAPAPESVPNGGTNPIDFIPTETLIKVIGDLPKEDDFAQNKGKQDAVVQLTEILKSRPVLPPEQPEGAAPVAPAAAPAPVPPPVTASSKKADLGDHAMGDDGNIGGGSSPSQSISPSAKPNGTTSLRDEAPATPEKATIGFGGLNLSSLEEEKTADDFRTENYKITDEGVRPEFRGGAPSMQHQEEYGVPPTTEFPNEMIDTPTRGALPMHASVKVGVTPPGISEELMHKLKKEYPGDKEKAYATAWSIHNKKESALKEISAALDKFAAGYGGGWYTSYKPLDVTEDGGRTPEIGEAHSKLEDHTGISHPATTEPIKLNDQQGLKTGAKVAAEMTTGKAVKESEQIGNDLKKMYLDAKSLTQVNDTRAVREAVEAIFRAADMFDEATKTLNKQHQQEESEAEAAKVKSENKGKKSSFGGLAVAAGE
jgi:hypothetical protein